MKCLKCNTLNCTKCKKLNHKGPCSLELSKETEFTNFLMLDTIKVDYDKTSLKSVVLIQRTFVKNGDCQNGIVVYEKCIDYKCMRNKWNT